MTDWGDLEDLGYVGDLDMDYDVDDFKEDRKKLKAQSDCECDQDWQTYIMARLNDHISEQIQTLDNEDGSRRYVKAETPKKQGHYGGSDILTGADINEDGIPNLGEEPTADDIYEQTISDFDEDPKIEEQLEDFEIPENYTDAYQDTSLEDYIGEPYRTDDLFAEEADKIEEPENTQLQDHQLDLRIPLPIDSGPVDFSIGSLEHTTPRLERTEDSSFDDITLEHGDIQITTVEEGNIIELSTPETQSCDDFEDSIGQLAETANMIYEENERRYHNTSTDEVIERME